MFPVLIVHQRGSRENYLVVEFKKSTRNGDRQFDLQMLRGYKQQLGYVYALFVETDTVGQSCITAVE